MLTDFWNMTQDTGKANNRLRHNHGIAPENRSYQVHSSGGEGDSGTGTLVKSWPTWQVATRGCCARHPASYLLCLCFVRSGGASLLFVCVRGSLSDSATWQPPISNALTQAREMQRTREVSGEVPDVTTYAAGYDLTNSLVHVAHFQLGSFLIGPVSSWARFYLHSFPMTCRIRDGKR